MHQWRRDRDTDDVMRLALEGQVLAGVAEPSERVEDARLLLIRLRVPEEERSVVFGVTDRCAEDGDEAVPMRRPLAC